MSNDLCGFYEASFESTVQIKNRPVHTVNKVQQNTE